MSFPKNVAIFTGSFVNVGLSNEQFKVQWNYPGTTFGTKSFNVGSEIFLETATNMASVPDEQLISSLSMSAILAGEILPGTQEFLDSILGQDNKYFQTIVGDAKLKIAPTPVSDPSVGPEGTVYDLQFARNALLSSTKTVRADTWSICQYGNRVDSPDHAVGCVPGSIHAEFGFKKSQLGADGSANRLSVIAWLASQRFWI